MRFRAAVVAGSLRRGTTFVAQATPPSWQSARAQVARAVRFGDRDAEERARRELKAARLAAHIKEVVESAPALTHEQIERLRALLPKPVTSGEIGDAPDAAA